MKYKKPKPKIALKRACTKCYPTNYAGKRVQKWVVCAKQYKVLLDAIG